MKITKQKLIQIIKEEMAEAMLTLELFSTASAGEDVGALSYEDMKDACSASGGKWVEEKDEFGKPLPGGYCDI